MVLAAVLLVVTYAFGIAQQRSATIDTLLRAAVEQKQVPMAVAMVADSRGVVYEQAVGASKDAIFAIASMTKPVTSVAVMQLVEAGRVKLDEPAATYVPELATVRVYEGGKLRAPKSPPTVHQLLTHTAGFGYEFVNRDVFELVAKKEVPTMMGGSDAFLKAPLLFDPGAQWEYGINTDWLGKLVERVSGQTLDAYFREKIFTPLDMHDSFFTVPAEKRSRVVRTFQRSKDGGIAEVPPLTATTVEFFSGGGGLFSTAPDYLTFVRTLMAGGRLGDKRILSAQSVAQMGSNQLGALSIRPISSVLPQFATDGAILTGDLDKFGLGFAINTKPTSVGRGANTMTWAGIFNTFFWIDREKQVAAVLMSQMLPFLDPGPKRLLEEFDAAVYAMRSRPSR
jgi:CubicO group peptidase (beta-lactamase class C family)